MREESMIERVAQAIADTLVKEGTDGSAWYQHYEPSTPLREALAYDGEVYPLVIARAAIEAMREPTEAMVEAFYDESHKTHPEDRFDVDTFPKLYGALIDKALT